MQALSLGGSQSVMSMADSDLGEHVADENIPMGDTKNATVEMNETELQVFTLLIRIFSQITPF